MDDLDAVLEKEAGGGEAETTEAADDSWFTPAAAQGKKKGKKAKGNAFSWDEPDAGTTSATPQNQEQPAQEEAKEEDDWGMSSAAKKKGKKGKQAFGWDALGDSTSGTPAEEVPAATEAPAESKEEAAGATESVFGLGGVGGFGSFSTKKAGSVFGWDAIGGEPEKSPEGKEEKKQDLFGTSSFGFGNFSSTVGKAASTFGGWGSSFGLTSPTQEEPGQPALEGNQTQPEPTPEQEQETEADVGSWGFPTTTKGKKGKKGKTPDTSTPATPQEETPAAAPEQPAAAQADDWGFSSTAKGKKGKKGKATPSARDVFDATPQEETPPAGTGTEVIPETKEPEPEPEPEEKQEEDNWGFSSTAASKKKGKKGKAGSLFERNDPEPEPSVQEEDRKEESQEPVDNWGFTPTTTAKGKKGKKGKQESFSWGAAPEPTPEPTPVAEPAPPAEQPPAPEPAVDPPVENTDDWGFAASTQAGSKKKKGKGKNDASIAETPAAATPKDGIPPSEPSYAPITADPLFPTNVNDGNGAFGSSWGNNYTSNDNAGAFSLGSGQQSANDQYGSWATASLTGGYEQKIDNTGLELQSGQESASWDLNGANDNSMSGTYGAAPADGPSASLATPADEDTTAAGKKGKKKKGKKKDEPAAAEPLAPLVPPSSGPYGIARATSGMGNNISIGPETPMDELNNVAADVRRHALQGHGPEPKPQTFLQWYSSGKPLEPLVLGASIDTHVMKEMAQQAPDYRPITWESAEAVIAKERERSPGHSDWGRIMCYFMVHKISGPGTVSLYTLHHREAHRLGKGSNMLVPAVDFPPTAFSRSYRRKHPRKPVLNKLEIEDEANTRPIVTLSYWERST
ncbi:hypothetical protein PUNSTDRAFT_112729 [Punctularia strigosozonata HHB-11173 SS5]|uniref:uncharacterized protein n=1 Tax=Punctularia strigosozonata (strain HHB-11173) TaxID=741275 RepID=UPI00044177B3|nr:uncharacterized protein PUNSTDRAFT_112729 [Punctularia strigosozonata HHB-11173 SS5]EIN10941.1 hypothetical protein PUNSTDRAFT_112729 [Punctularia strigosozonata HHB-11173 SS5]